MNSKFFEIRDEGTTITAIAIKTEGDNEKENLHFRRGGWGKDTIILIKTNSEAIANYDAFAWRKTHARTMFEAHKYIENNYDIINNFDVIDVQFILGETKKCKISEVLNG